MNSFSPVLEKRVMLLLAINLWLFVTGAFAQFYNDVSLQKIASQSEAEVGDNVTFFILVYNEGKTSLSGLSVIDTLPAGTAYLSHVAPSNTTYDPVSGIWNIGDAMTAGVDFLELQIVLKITGEGLIFNAAEVFSMNEFDVDSEPANHFLPEDDQAGAAVSVPLRICTSLGESYTLKAPPGFTNYEWFWDDGSGPVLVGTEMEFVAGQPGRYTFSVFSNGCPLGMSCPVIVEECLMINEPPVAIFDETTTPPGTSVSIEILSNDSDPDGSLDAGTLTVTLPPVNGTVFINPDGSVTYTPNAGFSGQDSFIYEICDNGDPVLCDTALVLVTVGEMFFDLSLEKTLLLGQPALVDLGDEIHYQLTVTNEGMFAASNIEITDHIPAGLALGPVNPGWVLLPSGDAAFNIAGPLLPGESVTIDIVMTVVYGASGQTISNVAELTGATDEFGNPVPDIDSTPDNGEDGEDDQDSQDIELEPHDPTGYIYCETTGELVTGGFISVTGPGEVFMMADGSTGYYEFYTDGTPGIYEITYNYPAGYVSSQTCNPQPGALDPTGNPNPLVLGADTSNFQLTNIDCAANPYYLVFDLEPGDPFVFNNNIPVVCPNDLIAEDSVTINVNCDLSDPLWCFDLPYQELSNYDFELNGSPYEAEFGPCSYLRDRYYTYVSLLGFGNTGPYRLEYWNVDGVVHSADFQTLDELVVLMNQWDTNGNWQHNAQAKSIVGGDPHTFYSKMTIRQLTTGSVAVLDLYELFAQNSSYLILPEGENTLVITSLSSGVTDTVHLRVACVSPDFVEITQPVGASDTICLNMDELQGDVAAIFNPCLESFDNASDLAVIPGTNCVEAFGMFSGETQACYVICDDLGICDTTYILVTVYDDELNPQPDSLCTAKDTPVIGEVLLNDEVPAPAVSVTVLDEPEHGSVVVNPDFTITYVPDEGYCHDDENEPLDHFTYEVCTADACASTEVYVLVKCDGVIVYNGFSPDGDGVNDFFKIEGLQNYPNHNIMVFNRWGNKVFESKNYRNNWDGWYHDKKLPFGTYFYLIDLGDGSDWLSGYLQIIW